MYKIVSESDDFLLVNVDGNLYNYNTESSTTGGQPVPIVQVKK